jgi:CheY-like chemotaxis protein
MSQKILIVEDNQDCREFLVFLVRRLGYEPIPVHTGEEAIARATANHPALIFMDLGLPGIDGLEAAAAIKRNPETAGIPIVALSARSEETSKEKALDAGMTMYLSKPAPPALIKETIERFISADSTTNLEGRCAPTVVDSSRMPYASLL